MHQLLDFIPLLFFVIVYPMDERTIDLFGYEYTLGGIFSATQALIVSTVLVYGYFLLKNRRLTRTQWITVIAVIVFCSFTLIFRSETILKWKAPVVNWIFASIFIASHYFGKKTAIQHMLGHALTLPEVIWRKLNIAWAGCFFFLGCANLFVAFTFHEIWVYFKVYGSIGILLLFNIAQMFYLAPYLKDEDEDELTEAAKVDGPETDPVPIEASDIEKS